jgi:superfamily II DNA or RNA helicase
MMLTLSFDSGTLIIKGSHASLSELPYIKYDERIRAYRCEARFYADLILILTKNKIPHEDKARIYQERSFQFTFQQEVRSYQAEALQIWKKARKGYIVLPTGAGKSYLALLAVHATQRDTLIVVPTLDLMHQWYGLIITYFSQEPGLIGGGYFEIKDITISTYDSAWMHMERMGNRFGMIIFDECHHLPGESYSLSAIASIAPFRLGLSATPERSDGQESLLDPLIGPCLYRKGIKDLAGFTLSEYAVRKVYVELAPEEKALYEEHRKIYLDFLKEKKIGISQPGGWSRFIQISSRSIEGRKAFQSYLQQKSIVQTSSCKMKFLERLLKQHYQSKMIIFTSDNATVYKISSQFLVPAITHQTKIKERREILEKFQSGNYNAIVTSKVLNEGVDLPEANVGVILSGSGSVREHVQRLGRILRKKEGKQAILYEVVTRSTSEEYVSQRRAQHEAYQD